ncbi:hypothetical protein SADUNF_Sadunf03G0000900 [Salix dunnii]|uniref:Uncharacterized protein n=1 Tax=Salix dunnii TaxID=1413687 RepID=A0A835K8Y9_9ROSI|nr:hypothetical protein SADUNF_Sadunf03G0000900 [Salix dunnii]
MSLVKEVVLFQKLGLGDLCVMPKKPGILTRHDFTPDHILGLYLTQVGDKLCNFCCVKTRSYRAVNLPLSLSNKGRNNIGYESYVIRRGRPKARNTTAYNL